MRRQDRQLAEAQAWELLSQAEHGVLATVDASGQPYAVPLNHVRVGNCLYFHCALDGHKLDNLAAEPRASYAVITRAQVEPGAFSTAYESVIAFGRAHLVEGEDERILALRALNHRFAPHLPQEGEATLERWFGQTAVLRLDIEHLTAKARPQGQD